MFFGCGGCAAVFHRRNLIVLHEAVTVSGLDAEVGRQSGEQKTGDLATAQEEIETCVDKGTVAGLDDRPGPQA